MTPTYVAKRVGDEYIMIRVDAEGVIQRAGLAGLGLGLLGYGLFRKGLVGMVTCAAGSALAYYGWTGRSPLQSTGKRAATPASTAPVSPTGSHQHRSADTKADALDEALMESFPASDPPASMRKNPAI